MLIMLYYVVSRIEAQFISKALLPHGNYFEIVCSPNQLNSKNYIRKKRHVPPVCQHFVHDVSAFINYIQGYSVVYSTSVFTTVF